jgi:hypothetical protein
VHLNNVSIFDQNPFISEYNIGKHVTYDLNDLGNKLYQYDKLVNDECIVNPLISIQQIAKTYI